MRTLSTEVLLHRFLVLVTGTLVYGKGDKLEAQREGLLDADEERIFAPVASALPGETQPSAVPGHRRQSGDTAPIAMRATPGSLKVRMMIYPQRACCIMPTGGLEGCFHALSVCADAACCLQCNTESQQQKQQHDSHT